MKDEIRAEIALARFKLISPVLAEPGRVQNEYFRSQTVNEHELPHYGRRRIKLSTFKLWLRQYRRGGFEGLKPKSRADSGRPRRLQAQTLAAIEGKRKAYPTWTARMLYDDLLRDGQLGQPPVCYNTLVRTLHHLGLMQRDRARNDVRKRFEHAEVGALWLCDFMHGPVVRVGKGTAKAILCAIIDDHSRMIVGHAFSANETVSSLVIVMKEALMAHGVCRRFYVDNGAAFSADLLVKSCALAGISLIHSKPYDSPSRGKIERFFRTVRDRFLPGLAGDITLDELNEAFAIWIQKDYHHRLHSGIDQRPIDRYQASISRIEVKRLTAAELDEIFLVRHERVVGNDATISFNGRIYEVPAAYIRRRVEIRHPVDAPTELALYDKGARIARLKLVDVQENARVFRPSGDDRQVSFAYSKVVP
jgi:transposase InsO family protein